MPIERLNGYQILDLNGRKIDGGQILAKVIGYYEKLQDLRIFSLFKNQIKEIAGVVMTSLPGITEVYGVGYPFYGNIDIKRRIKLLNRASLSVQQIVNRILPDIDLMVIFKSDEGPHFLKADLDEDFKHLFCQENGKNLKLLKSLFSNLKENFKIADRNKSAADQFVEDDLLHIDFLPIPLHVWKDIPVFIKLEDKQYFKFIRDIMFTAELLSAKVSSALPLDFRMNYILNLIRERNVSGREELFELILFEQPYAELIRMFSETRKVVKKNGRLL